MPVKKGYNMRDQIECIQNLVLHMQAELDEINERCKIALNTKETGATIAQQANHKICPSCHGSGNSYCGIGLEMGTCLSCNGTGKLS